MFNDLNGQNNNAANKVDDIFAETDKTTNAPYPPLSASPANNPEIETSRVGLVSGNDGEKNDSSKNRWLKIALIVIVVIIIILGAYLVYAKVFSGQTANEQLLSNTVDKTTETETVNKTAGTFVEPASKKKADDLGETTSSNTPEEITSENQSAVSAVDGQVANSEEGLPATPEAMANGGSLSADSDNDGLLDSLEKTIGTNINVIDTDNDGLSDYEEVEVYHTNPLNADSDGDTYADGEEVKNGYDPNGPGKLAR